ncbi:MAG TPA: hypothetical protein PKA74_14405, partial [Bauldia sp.]|nr:hypothetical protein [Bauldia sp.]
MGARLERLVEGDGPFAALIRLGGGEGALAVEDLDGRARRREPGDHGIAGRLDADDVEGRDDHLDAADRRSLGLPVAGRGRGGDHGDLDAALLGRGPRVGLQPVD